MKLQDFIYELPEELIAQDPLEERSLSRLLVLNKATGDVTHESFRDIKKYLRPGDILVLNNTKVIPARLRGVRAGTLGAVEILLLNRRTKDIWECLTRPARRLRKGAGISFGDLLSAEIIEELDEGRRLIRFSCEGVFEEILDSLGEVPLPPYIKHELKDRGRYQTVYAEREGSAAAPTAGLHFTEELLDEIEAMGVNIVKVTLNVGLGTFRPVKAEDIENHTMHSEYFELSEEAAARINEARDEGGRVFAVGTTSVRVLETAAARDGHLEAMSGETDIYIYPGYKWKIVDALITNFHLPGSTLIMLVSSFAGREAVLSAYGEAVKERYRFFSFGDAMLIV